MSINFKKLNSQIKPFKSEAKRSGYIFLATDEQKRNDIFSISKPGSKRSLLKTLVHFIQSDKYFNKEFTL